MMELNMKSKLEILIIMLFCVSFIDGNIKAEEPPATRTIKGKAVNGGGPIQYSRISNGDNTNTTITRNSLVTSALKARCLGGNNLPTGVTPIITAGRVQTCISPTVNNFPVELIEVEPIVDCEHCKYGHEDVGGQAGHIIKICKQYDINGNLITDRKEKYLTIPDINRSGGTHNWATAEHTYSLVGTDIFPICNIVTGSFDITPAATEANPNPPPLRLKYTTFPASMYITYPPAR